MGTHSTKYEHCRLHILTASNNIHRADGNIKHRRRSIYNIVRVNGNGKA